MEQIRTRTFIIGTILILAGLAITLIPTAQEKPITQQWLDRNAPMHVGNYRMIPSPQNPWESYRMPHIVYDYLKPDGMLARVYQNDHGKRYDVVLVVSRSKSSFHDPEVCFSSQGWVIKSTKQEQITTKNLGVIPITVVKMSSESEKDQLAAFFYKGPNGYYDGTGAFKWGLLRDDLFHSKEPEGVFFRFIPNFPGEDSTQLKKFMVKYIEAAHQTSNGFF